MIRSMCHQMFDIFPQSHHRAANEHYLKEYMYRRILPVHWQTAMCPQQDQKLCFLWLEES